MSYWIPHCGRACGLEWLEGIGGFVYGFTNPRTVESVPLFADFQCEIPSPFDWQAQ